MNSLSFFELLLPYFLFTSPPLSSLIPSLQPKALGADGMLPSALRNDNQAVADVDASEEGFGDFNNEGDEEVITMLCFVATLHTLSNPVL